MTDGALLAESNQTPCVWRGNSSPPVKDFTRHNKKARSHSRRVMDTNLCTSPIYCGSEPVREAFRAEPQGSVLVHLSHQFRLSLGQAAGLGQFIDAGAHADQACRLGERQA